MRSTAASNSGTPERRPPREGYVDARTGKLRKGAFNVHVRRDPSVGNLNLWLTLRGAGCAEGWGQWLYQRLVDNRLRTFTHVPEDVVGMVVFKPLREGPVAGPHYGDHLTVAEQYRRLGLASYLYDLAERRYGLQLRPSTLTRDGKAFWKARRGTS